MREHNSVRRQHYFAFFNAKLIYRLAVKVPGVNTRAVRGAQHSTRTNKQYKGLTVSSEFFKSELFTIMQNLL